MAREGGVDARDVAASSRTLLRPRGLWHTCGVRRLAIVLALIVLSLVAFRIAMGPVFDSQWFRGLVKAGVERGLGVEPTLVGSVHPAFSLIPGVDFESVHVRSPEGADWWLDADVQRASLRIGLLPLLWGKLEVLRFEVDGLELRFELPPDDGSDEPSSSRPTW